jgi:hypothetical protein
MPEITSVSSIHQHWAGPLIFAGERPSLYQGGPLNPRRRMQSRTKFFFLIEAAPSIR